MKKSILALSAAVAVSGLGFAGAANALAVFGDGTLPAPHTTNATGLQLTASGVGHYLFAPYFTTQGDNNTLVSVVNTDTVNGKAVKVRFRGAANSDDVLDFTLFLSPGDVWTGSLIQGADALSHLSTQDTSCTLPANIKDQPFLTGRLDQNLSDDALAAHTREGYVEFLNMADIPPNQTPGSLYRNIKHVDGKAPCAMTAFETVLNDNLVDAATAQAAGLAAPTGGLTGGWVIVRLSNISTYSGLLTAVQAQVAPGVSGTGRLAFAPQSVSPVTAGSGLATLEDVTADPLLSGLTPVIEPLWMDLPDMSTPLLAGIATGSFGALAQAETLSASLAKASVGNEFVSTAAGASVPGDTDWVISQPTRRYLMAYNYNVANGVDGRVFSGSNPAGGGTLITGLNPYARTTTQVVANRTLDGVNFGSFICLRGTFRGTDREEGALDRGVSFSPAPAAAAYCGEVFTLSFNREKSEVLSAGLTNQKVSIAIAGKAPEAGWATFTPNAVAGSEGVPMLGFAATSLLNREQQGNYGYTYAHRW